MTADRCRRSCCWVPYTNMCGRDRKCDCHPDALEQLLRDTNTTN